MGRRKLELKKIESKQKRNKTFVQWQKNLFKKANELAILCDAQVAVIAFNETGDMDNFSSTDMQQILARYRSHLENKEGRARYVKCKQEEYSEVVHDLKEEISNSEALQRSLDKDISSMSLLQLCQFEQAVTEKLLSTQKMQEQLQEQLDEQLLEQMKQKNETTHGQVDALQGFSPSTSSAGVAAQQPTRFCPGIDLNVEPGAGEIQASDKEIQPAGLGGSLSNLDPAFDDRLSSCVYQSTEPTNSEIQASNSENMEPTNSEIQSSNSEMRPAGLGGSFSSPHPAFNYSVWP